MFRNIKAALASLAMMAALSGQAVADGAFFEVTKGAETKAIGPTEYATIGEAEITTKVLTMGDSKRQVKGVLARKLLDYMSAGGESVTIVALDGYTLEVPVEDLVKYDVVVATQIDGKRLSVRDKGPAWLIYPVSDHKELDDTVYEARSVWQIKSITVN